MSYSAQITRKNPSAFLFLIDQSGSMAEAMAGAEPSEPKAAFVARAVNRWLRETVLRCSKEEVRDYFHVAMIGYGANIASAWRGSLHGKTMAPISEIAVGPVRIDHVSQKIPDGAGGLVEQTVPFPVWIDPVSDNGTPMCAALREAKSILEEWISQHPRAYPPTVVHITDGAATDEGSPLELARSITSLHTDDGNVLMINCHVSSVAGARVVLFPQTVEELPPDPYAKLLFEMSSTMPPAMREAAKAAGWATTDATRVYAFSADASAFLYWLIIGTSTETDKALIESR